MSMHWRQCRWLHASVHPKGNPPEHSLEGRTETEAEAPILWVPDAKSWLTGKDPEAGKDWGREERGWQRTRWLDGIDYHWTRTWANSGRWWRTEEPGVLQSMGSQRVGHDLATELNYVPWYLLSVLQAESYQVLQLMLLYKYCNLPSLER